MVYSLSLEAYKLTPNEERLGRIPTPAKQGVNAKWYLCLAPGKFIWKCVDNNNNYKIKMRQLKPPHCGGLFRFD